MSSDAKAQTSSRLEKVLLKCARLYFNRDISKWITRTLIIAGIGLVSSPVWWQLIETIIEDWMQVDVPPAIGATGWILIFLGFANFLLDRFSKRHIEPRARIAIAINATERQETTREGQSILMTDVVIAFKNEGDADAREVVPHFCVFYDGDCVLNEDAVDNNDESFVIRSGANLCFEAGELVFYRSQAIRQRIELHGTPVIFGQPFKFRASVAYTDDSTIETHDSPVTQFQVTWLPKYPDDPLRPDIAVEVRGPSEVENQAD